MQAFTAIGQLPDDDLYEFNMNNGFVPWRRHVLYEKTAREVPIRPLLDRLDLTKGKANWGYQLRLGLLKLTAHDFELIKQKML